MSRSNYPRPYPLSQPLQKEYVSSIIWLIVGARRPCHTFAVPFTCAMFAGPDTELVGTVKATMGGCIKPKK